MPKPIQAKITAGLVRDRDAAEGNYGVCFYLNGRPVAKELKTRDVGYFVAVDDRYESHIFDDNANTGPEQRPAANFGACNPPRAFGLTLSLKR